MEYWVEEECAGIRDGDTVRAYLRDPYLIFGWSWHLLHFGEDVLMHLSDLTKRLVSCTHRIQQVSCVPAFDVQCCLQVTEKKSGHRLGFLCVNQRIESISGLKDYE